VVRRQSTPFAEAQGRATQCAKTASCFVTMPKRLSENKFVGRNSFRPSGRQVRSTVNCIEHGCSPCTNARVASFVG